MRERDEGAVCVKLGFDLQERSRVTKVLSDLVEVCSSPPVLRPKRIEDSLRAGVSSQQSSSRREVCGPLYPRRDEGFVL